MITLHLAIGKEDDIPVFEFETPEDLLKYLNHLDMFDCVWLLSDDNQEGKGEIIIHEDINIINGNIADMLYTWVNPVATFFLQDYETYEEAYRVALSMREKNKKCYG